MIRHASITMCDLRGAHFLTISFLVRACDTSKSRGVISVLHKQA